MLILPRPSEDLKAQGGLERSSHLVSKNNLHGAKHVVVGAGVELVQEQVRRRTNRSHGVPCAGSVCRLSSKGEPVEGFDAQ